MNLGPSAEDAMLADSAARFLHDHYVIRHGKVRPRAPGEMWRRFAELGWLALPIAEAHGGLAAPLSTLAVLMEQLGRAAVPDPLLPVIVVAAGLLADCPGGAALLQTIADGSQLVVAALRADVTATAEGEGWRLDGTARLVIGADIADVVLIPARVGDRRLAVFAVDRSRGGVAWAAFETIDGRGAADITLTAAVLDGAALIATEGVAAAKARAEDRGAALACADALGAMTVLVEATIAHTGTRTQFGRRLRDFQVIEHGLADMIVLLAEARAATALALASLATDEAARRRLLDGAKAKLGITSRRIAQQAIQWHGAMGVTEELSVGVHVKRLLGFELGHGSGEHRLQQLAAALRGGMGCGSYLAELCAAQPEHGGTLALSAAEQRFCAEIADFLDQSLPAALRLAQRMTTAVYPPVAVGGAWQAILHARGWSAPNWPAAFGGTGWSPVQRYLWAQEAGKRWAPVFSPIGLPLVGPVLMHFGTAAQQRRYLPPILSGAECWCQGFSEPGAGSDLAALSTRAVLDGAEYVVNGTKIWTTHGHVAQWMAALVRTGPPGSRRDGISFLIIDLQAPGVDIRPIVSIGGDHELNQIFLESVRVPIDNRVGDEGQGWDIAKFLLDHERGGDIMSAGIRPLLNDVQAQALARAIDDAGFWQRLALLLADLDTLEMLELQTMLGSAPNTEAMPSILKLRVSALLQGTAELGLEVVGCEALRPGAGPEAAGEPSEAYASRYLNSRACTIYGGSREIQKGIIARALLGR